MKKNTVITAGLVIAALAGGFFGGMKYQQSKQPALSTFFSGGAPGTRMNGQFQGSRGGAGRMTGARQVVGEVINKDETSFTVKLPDGSSKIVLFSGKTSFNKTQEGSMSDLKEGEKVGVFGTENTDGSVTAQNIQLNFVQRNIPITPAK